MQPFVNIATKAAFAAGEVITQHLYRLDHLKVTEKEANHWVSEVDLKAEKVIIEHIRKVYPDHAILTEESGYLPGSNLAESSSAQRIQEAECVWIIDPLDGTHNYLHGMPHYCVSIAVQIKHRIEHAVIYDPTRNECFSASRGYGALCNDKKLRVAPRKNLKEALLGASFSFYNEQSREKYMAVFQAFGNQCLGLRRMGSAALDLAYVAAGRLDGVWAFGLQPWDIAAGSLIVKESGGLVGDMDGTEHYLNQGALIAGNPKIFKALLQTIQPVISK